MKSDHTELYWVMKEAQHRINIEEFNNFSFNVFSCLAKWSRTKGKRKIEGKKIGEKSVKSEFISNKGSDSSFDHKGRFFLCGLTAKKFIDVGRVNTITDGFVGESRGWKSKNLLVFHGKFF